MCVMSRFERSLGHIFSFFSHGIVNYPTETEKITICMILKKFIVLLLSKYFVITFSFVIKIWSTTKAVC